MKKNLLKKSKKDEKKTLRKYLKKIFKKKSVNDKKWKRRKCKKKIWEIFLYLKFKKDCNFFTLIIFSFIRVIIFKKEN